MNKIWYFCPECGSEETYRIDSTSTERCCKYCYQIWFIDSDYTETIRINLRNMVNKCLKCHLENSKDMK